MQYRTNFPFTVKFGKELDGIKKAKFIFKQGEVKKVFVYPDDETTQRVDEGICLQWTIEDTEQFDCNHSIQMQPMISFFGTDYNPETKINTLLQLNT